MPLTNLRGHPFDGLPVAHVADLVLTADLVRHVGERFDLTAVGRTLVTDAPGSMRSVVLMIGDPRYQSVWSELPEAVRTGGPRAEAVHGVPMWELLDRDPDPDDDVIREAISGQICRCTGYATIVRSIRWAAEHPATDGAATAPATAEEVPA